MNQEGEARWQTLSAEEPNCIKTSRTNCLSSDLPAITSVDNEETDIFGGFDEFGGFGESGGFGETDNDFGEFDGFGETGNDFGEFGGFGESGGFGEADDGFGGFGGFGESGEKSRRRRSDDQVDVVEYNDWECSDASGNPLDNWWDTFSVGTKCKLKCKDGYEDSLCELQFET